MTLRRKSAIEIDWRTTINGLNAVDPIKGEEAPLRESLTEKITKDKEQGNLIKIITEVYLFESTLTKRKFVVKSNEKLFSCGHMSLPNAVKYVKKQI